MLFLRRVQGSEKISLIEKRQGCNKGQKSGGAGSNEARRRCPAAPSDLPKSGRAAAPPAPPLVACLIDIYTVIKGFSAISAISAGKTL